MPTVIESRYDDDGSLFRRSLIATGRLGLRATVKVYNVISSSMQDSSVKLDYTPSTDRLRFVGESEFSGDRINRVRNLGDLAYMQMLLCMYPALLFFRASVSSPTGVSGLMAAMISWGFIFMAISSYFVIHATEVIDYTTPVSEVDDSIKESYLKGEIDEDELEKKLEVDLK